MGVLHLEKEENYLTDIAMCNIPFLVSIDTK